MMSDEVGLIVEGKAILSLSTIHLWPQCHLVTLSVVTKQRRCGALVADALLCATRTSTRVED